MGRWDSYGWAAIGTGQSVIWGLLYWEVPNMFRATNSLFNCKIDHLPLTTVLENVITSMFYRKYGVIRILHMSRILHLLCPKAAEFTISGKEDITRKFKEPSIWDSGKGDISWKLKEATIIVSGKEISQGKWKKINYNSLWQGRYHKENQRIGYNSFCQGIYRKKCQRISLNSLWK